MWNIDVDKDTLRKDVHEIIEEVLWKFINETAWDYNKEYRNSVEYQELSQEEKFQKAIDHSGLQQFKNMLAERFTQEIHDIL